jgi:hypothetical protein
VHPRFGELRRVSRGLQIDVLLIIFDGQSLFAGLDGRLPDVEQEERQRLVGVAGLERLDRLVVLADVVMIRPDGEVRASLLLFGALAERRVLRPAHRRQQAKRERQQGRTLTPHRSPPSLTQARG